MKLGVTSIILWKEQWNFVIMGPRHNIGLGIIFQFGSNELFLASFDVIMFDVEWQYWLIHFGIMILSWHEVSCFLELDLIITEDAHKSSKKCQICNTIMLNKKTHSSDIFQFTKSYAWQVTSIPQMMVCKSKHHSRAKVVNWCCFLQMFLHMMPLQIQSWSCIFGVHSNLGTCTETQCHLYLFSRVVVYIHYFYVH